MTTTATKNPTTTTSTKPSPAYAVLIGLTSLTVLLQGVWAGVFLGSYNTDTESKGWIDVHARGADVAIVLALLATAAGFATRHAEKQLWIGSGVLAVLLILESYLGGQVRDGGHVALLVIHVPLAMALMALVVYLPLKSRSRKA